MADGIQKIEAEKPTGLELLREPFKPNEISKLPKETRNQIDERKANRSAMVWNCPECGGHHHKNAVHLDYVGHAALTNRLLDVDPHWNWEPVVMDGLPNPGSGMWIKLTVCGVSRLGYGDADGKTGGNAVKEVIGDALRNAAMRFGAALDLWHKGDLHADEPEAEPEAPPQKQQKPSGRKTKADSRDLFSELVASLRETESRTEQTAWFTGNRAKIKTLHEDFEALLNEEMRDRAAKHDAAKKGEADQSEPEEMKI